MPPPSHCPADDGEGRRLRTYVVLGYPDPTEGPGAPRHVTVVGTVRAAGRAVAGTLAHALARRRGRSTRPPTFAAHGAVRWWAAGACRTRWLLDGLARDGADLQSAR